MDFDPCLYQIQFIPWQLATQDFAIIKRDDWGLLWLYGVGESL
jgi:hypothetical protein